MAKPLTDILAPDALPTLPASPGILSDTLAPGPSFRPFADSTAMRRNIFNGVMTSVSKKYPLDNSRYSLSLAKLGYRNDKPFTLADQKKAIMQGDSLEHQLEGEWVLTDKATGKIVDRKRSVVAHVPYATDRGTFIYRGNEYTISNQMRLKPGVFTRVKENGIIEAHFNVRPGTGPSFRVHMEPDTGIFRLNVGQSNLKLYPILKAMGVSDRELEKSWGAGLLQKNVLAEDPRAVQRAFTKLVSTRADMAVGDDSESAEKVAEHLGAKASDRRWRKLWFRGTIRAENGKDGKPWVHVEVHKGLCDAALDSLKQEGVNVERSPNPAHITLVRTEELKPLIDKYGSKWSGAAKNGTPVRFALSRIVHLVPSGWKEISRVWFIEVESPDLVKYRKDLGLPALPKAEDGTDHRFHITFAVSRPKAEVKHAFELLSEKRAAALTGEPQEKPQSAISIEGQQLLNVFGKMELDDDVTTSTLGEPFKNVGVPAIMRTTRKLLNIQKGDEDIDDRDSLAYQTVHSPEDFFAERIEKDAGQIGRKMLWKATLRGNLKHVPSGVLTPQLQGVLLRSGMGMPLEEINPIDIFDQQLRVLRLGEGGILSTQSIPDEARSVQPSHFGFVDPIRAPECYDDKTEVMTKTGWKLWSDVTENTEFACLIEGRLEFHYPLKLINEPYNGLMYGAKTKFIDYLVTPNHRLWVKPQGHRQKFYNPMFRFELAEESRYACRLFCCGGHVPYAEGRVNFVLPPVEAEGAGTEKPGNPPIGAHLKLYREPIDIHDWAEFMGWYLSEGSLNGKYVVRITQSEAVNGEKCLRIRQLLNRLPFTWCFVDGDTFTISSKQLVMYLQQFGFCNDKFIPQEIFEAPVTAKRAFMTALLDGDGRMGKHMEPDMLCTTSGRLAEDFQRLAFQLGYSSRISFEPDDRKESYLGCHVVNLHRVTERLVVNKSVRHPGGQYYVTEYDGRVYCATVPGGLLYVRREKSVGFWCGNSEKIGVDARLAHGAYKGSDGRVYTDMLDARTGQRTPIPADLAAKSVVAFPGEMQKKGKTVRAMVGSRQVEYIDKGEVDYELISPSRMFTATSNLVPLISGIKGGRLLMGAKFIAQALPLKEPEAPLVQNLSDIQDRSFDDLYGRRVGAVHAESSGVVEAIDKNGIRVRYKDGTRTHELYDNFPFNRKTYVHNTPTVKIGDRVKTGDLLARSNFTDEAGTLAIGTNLRTAYMPYKGLNYEDAVVISEGAAKRLASEHMYQHNLDVADGDTEIGRKQFVSIYPSKYTRNQLSTVNNEGAVKPGTIVKYGDPLVLALSRTKTRGVHRGHTPIFTDSSLVWEHENEGIVTDVDKTKDGGLNVTVRAYLPAQEGDKLAGRFGDKGVISRVIPDDQMPQGADGKPYEILLNPLGVISRGNPSQIYETLLGKVARKRGQSLKVPSFMDENLIDYVKRELGRAGLTDVEDLVDPTNDSKVPAVLTGERFIMKLHHTAESKGRGRDIGGYTSEGLPARGGEFGSKRISNMEIGALLSHGATEVIRDAQVVRGQRNDDYWRAFRLGMTPPSPKVPLVYEKFLSYLQGAGINIRKDGNRLNLFALTDKDIDKLSSGAIENSQTVLGDTLSPVKGGLFDEHLTGGHGGTRWTHIKLSEPMPNPVMEEPIRRLLGMTQKQYEDVLSGRTELHGKVGGEAIKNALSQIRVDSSIEYYSGIVKDGPRSKRDNAVKVLGYLKTMQKHDLNPADFVLTKVPVLPPELRPITWFRGMSLTADPNFLYRDLIKLNEDLANMKGVVGNSQLDRERLKVYDAFKAVTGFGDPVQAKTQEKGVRGLLQHVFGSTPKVGMFQRRVLGSPVDIVGRATITPNPDLSMDQVGIPEPKAWTIYRPFVMRRLVRRGMPATAAAKAVSDQDPVAKKALLEEMESRPVMINRAPTMHRYGFMAAWPVLTKGHTLQISPVITPGFAADFDGDAMNYHVPVTDEAVKDAIDRMLPSKNLHSVRDFQVHYLPKNEFLLGLYLASTSREKKEKRVFRNKADVLAAYQRGELRVGDPVSVKE